ncbi:MAG: hypothetical protein MZV65_19855 [Chromatiales bacterium]|nr:hypothetical protein [Chromatiales bacterium]
MASCGPDCWDGSTPATCWRPWRRYWRWIMPFAEALTRVARTATVPGRMERLGGGVGQPLAVVDYAHTPHALEQVLSAPARSTRRAGCGACFGCGGDRDPGKRPLMGAVAERVRRPW